MKKIRLLLLFLLCCTKSAFTQNRLVKDTFEFRAVATNGSIEWDKLPIFSLPDRFKIIYQGPRFNDDSTQKPLSHGFTHLATYNRRYDRKLPFKHRAGYTTGVPRTPGLPWGSNCLSPWGNEDIILQQKLLEYVGYCEFFDECTGDNSSLRAPLDLFVHDFESSATNDAWILSLKNLACTPTQYAGLSDNAFLIAYKKAMIDLHEKAMQFTREKVVHRFTQLSMYGEPPMPMTFYQIGDQPWESYKTNGASNYLLFNKETLKYQPNGPVDKYMDFMTPWIYYFYNYPNGNKDYWSYLYLPYLLFNIEGNQLFTDKPIIPYIQMRVQDPSSGSPTQNINPEMAEATAIFALMGGASGLWVWDEINTILNHDPSNVRNFQPYEYFTAGLYRLSKHKYMFDGNFTYFRPKTAWDYAMVRQPVVRGIINGNRILIAANNPNADPSDVVNVTVEYKGWSDTITLTGREVYLGEALWSNCESKCAVFSVIKNQ